MNLLRTFLLAFGFLCIGGCSSTLIPSNDGGRFVLAEDTVYWGETNILNPDPWLFGLTKGEYIAVGHNDEGIYYRGPRGCVVVLLNPDGTRYLSTGERPDTAALVFAYGPNGEGGVFIPYDPNDFPFLYAYQDSRRQTGDQESKMPARPASEINSFKGDSPAGEVVPFRPIAVHVINSDNPGAPVDPATALGASIAPYVGRALAMPLVRRVQGKPLLLHGISDKKLQKRLHAHMSEQRYMKSSYPSEEKVASDK
ncbi:hypothetical protein ACX3YG_26135 [Pseudomonas wadenswilerensis]